MSNVDIEKLTGVANKVLSDFVVRNKYAHFLPVKNRRETWVEICSRNMMMHVDKFPDLRNEIINLYNKFVFTKKLLPSMRSMQFAGTPIELNNSRIFNCAFLPVDHYLAFSETLFLLLGGTGVGYSVQNIHISKLPKIRFPKKTKRYLIQDSIIGWSDAIKVLIKAYMKGKPRPIFDYRDIRPEGSPLKTTGGKAPGHTHLEIALNKIEAVLQTAVGRKLTDLEVHDIQCFLAECVLSGGIRRSAMISFFDKDSEAMLTCKAGEWWKDNGQRAMANNSAVLLRSDVTKQDFLSLWKKVQDSGSGEPGISFTNDLNMLSNPCHEIALKSNQFCNLVEINAAIITSQKELDEVSEAAAFLGTLQASYTDFHYLRPIWKKTTEREALLGVSMTGIASSKVLNLDLARAAKIAVETNRKTAKRIGIRPAARVTTVKPAGTTSLVLGSSSGIHAWYSPYYIRRVRINKTETVYKFLVDNHPEIVVDCEYNPSQTAILEIPIKAPKGAIFRDESVFDILERVKKVTKEWVREGHVSGVNTHNISTTISVKDDEWAEVGEWMWENRESYTGISVLPFDGGTYKQAPFEEISEEEYLRRLQFVKDVDFSKVIETEDVTDLSGEIACGGGNCEIK